MPTLDFLSRIVHHYRRQSLPGSLCSNRVRQHFLFALSAETNNQQIILSEVYVGLDSKDKAVCEL